MKPEEKWWELVAFFDPGKGKEIVHRGQKVFMLGNINEMLIAQIAEVYGNEKMTVARITAAQEILKILGCEKGIVITDAVKFVKLREVTDEEILAQLRKSKEVATH